MKLKPFFFIIFCVVLVIAGCKNKKESDTSIETKSTKITTSKDDQPDLPEKTKTVEKGQTKNYLLPQWPLKEKNEKGKVYPYDDGQTNAALNDFRQKLYNAVKRKDAKYVMSVVPDPASYPKGYDEDKINFMSREDLREQSSFWSELTFCLEHGGAYYKNNYDENAKPVFIIPSSAQSKEIFDPYTEGFIVGENVRLRESANSKSKVIGGLSWDVFTFLNTKSVPVSETIDGETYDWVQIKTRNGQKGYVYGKYIRRANSYSFNFTEVNPGNWKLTNIVVGD